MDDRRIGIIVVPSFGISGAAFARALAKLGESFSAQSGVTELSESIRALQDQREYAIESLLDEVESHPLNYYWSLPEDWQTKKDRTSFKVNRTLTVGSRRRARRCKKSKSIRNRRHK